MASYNGVQAAVLSRPGCRLILAMSLLTTKILAWLAIIHAVTRRSCAGHVSIGGSRGVPLWHSRVPAGDVTCELYCTCTVITIILCMVSCALHLSDYIYITNSWAAYFITYLAINCCKLCYRYGP